MYPIIQQTRAYRIGSEDGSTLHSDWNETLSLKERLCSLARDAGVELADVGDISVSINSINNEAYGSQNILLGDRQRYLLVLKRCRAASLHDRLTEQNRTLVELLSKPSYQRIKSQMVVGREVSKNGSDWLLYPFVDGKSAYVEIRSHLGNGKLLSLFERALAIAKKIDNAAIDDSPVASIIADSNASLKRYRIERQIPVVESSSPLRMGVAHLDFVPDNLLLGRTNDWLIDFEYWDNAPVLWNFLDIISTFGSLADLGPFSKRSAGDCLRIFFPPTSSIHKQLWRMIRTFAVETRTAGLTVEEMRGLIHAWFAAKAMAQPRVYGSVYGFSTRWLEIWDLARQDAIDHLANQWPR